MKIMLQKNSDMFQNKMFISLRPAKLAIALFVLLNVVSLLALFLWGGIRQFSITTFLLSAIFSFSFLSVLIEFILLISSRVLLLTILFFICVVSFIGLFVFQEFGVFVDENLLHFFVEDSQYLIDILSSSASNNLLVFFLVIFSLSFVLWLGVYKVYQLEKFLWKRLVVFFVISLISLNQLNRFYTSDFLTMDSQFLIAIKKALNSSASGLKLLKPSRKRVSVNAFKSTGYNVVLVVQESMSKEPFSVYGYQNNFTPFLKKFVEDTNRACVRFDDAMAISGCTDMSMPTMMTGVGPEKGYEGVMQKPFLWDYAKAGGYQTAYFSSQRYSWKNFRQFFKNESLDLLYTAENTSMPVVNDVGIDDVFMSEMARQFILGKKKGRPMFMVFNTNALHKPFQKDSKLIQIPETIKDRYFRAMYIIDKSMESLISAYKEIGEMDKTIFVFTSDHGEYAIKHLQRLGSFYKEALDIPFYISFPKSWVKENKLKLSLIMKNKNVRISNLDIMPTIIDVLGGSKLNDLEGESLFDEINNSRMITCLSTNDYRVWTNEGYGLYRDTLSYLFDKKSLFQLYNLKIDSSQEENLILENKEIIDGEFLPAVQKNRFLNRIYMENKSND